MQFDELHVVSDLHLGGQTGFQIFNQGGTLAATIDGLAARDPQKRIGLVLNGDIVDYLAEKPSAYLDPEGAITKLQRIIADPAFNPVWIALRAFVNTENRQLVMVLGNHDVELALPTVVNWLTAYLANGDEAARGRIVHRVDGAGFQCTVGEKRVLCVHGNEVDSWNVVDYKQLLDVSRSLNRGLKPAPWTTNGGTKLVIDTMNNVKKDYPMVDLLKPENEAVVPVILALDPSRAKEIPGALRAAAIMGRDTIRMAGGFLSADDETSELVENSQSDEELMNNFLSRHYNDKSGMDPNSGDLLGDALKTLDRGVTPEDTVDTEFLGTFDLIGSVFGKKKSREQYLRAALKDLLKNDRTFELKNRDKTFQALDKVVGLDIDYLIAGHTHLERAIERNSSCFYFNSGTWIRLIKLTDEMLDDADQFNRIFSAFGAGSIEALDQIDSLGANGKEKLIILKPTVVSIVCDNGKVFGELNHAQPSGELVPVPDSRLSRD